MVVGAIPAIIRLGQIAYRVYRFQDRAIGKAYRGFPRGVRQGVVHGSTLGTLSGGIIESLKDEAGGNIVGIPETVGQRQYNRLGKARSSLFKSARRRRGRYRNCYSDRKKYSRY